MPDGFINKSTLRVARELLGCIIQTKINNRITSGKIVEVEAYRGDIDLACHCYYKRTKRNEVMFGMAGLSYVYFIYGMYHCVNVVTEKEGFGAAVLIRAVEPVRGLDIIKKRRKFSGEKLYNLTNGPGKLCQALAIDTKLSSENLLKSNKIRLIRGEKVPKKLICSATRIGISKSKELPWRFYIKGNPWVSHS